MGGEGARAFVSARARRDGCVALSLSRRRLSVSHSARVMRVAKSRSRAAKGVGGRCDRSTGEGRCGAVVCEREGPRAVMCAARRRCRCAPLAGRAAAFFFSQLVPPPPLAPSPHNTHSSFSLTKSHTKRKASHIARHRSLCLRATHRPKAKKRGAETAVVSSSASERAARKNTHNKNGLSDAPHGC